MSVPFPLLLAFGAVMLLSLPFVLRIVIAATKGRAIGARSLAKQPDTIALLDAASTAWNRLGDIQSLEQPLLARGFISAGIFRIRELPGVVVQLLVDEPHAVLACLYEHPIAGVWAELVVRSTDGAELIVTNNRPTGLSPRPSVTIVNVRGGSAEALCVTLARQGGHAPRTPVTVEAARATFEQAWADSVAYRKSVGISTAEVVRVAARRIA